MIFSKTFKPQKPGFEEKKSEKIRKKWGNDEKPQENIRTSLVNRNRKEPIKPQDFIRQEILEEDDQSLVNCIDSLDMESVNFLRESMKLVLKKPEKALKNDEIEEILEEMPENPEIIKEIKENIKEIEENEEIQEEILPIKQEIKEKKPEFIKKNVKIIKARPISANFQSLDYKELRKDGSEGLIFGNFQRINTNPFSRPQTEISNRKDQEKKKETEELIKVNVVYIRGFHGFLREVL